VIRIFTKNYSRENGNPWISASAGMTIFIVCFFLSACGFQPLYSNTNTLAGGTSVHEKVWIQSVSDIAGVKLRNALIDRFYHHGTPEDPTYILTLGLRENVRNVIIERNDFASRAQLVLSADYTLRRRDTRVVVETGTLRSTSSYNILSSQYTTLVTQDEARDLAIQDLADKMTQRVAVLLR
jgi:LPS-assembly lipoprotein